MPREIAFRAATVDDADRLARAFVEGVEVYRSFTPAHWPFPSAAGEAEHLRRILSDADAWCLVAEVEGEVVGQVAILPATRAARPVEDPGLAHLRNLIVDAAYWGTGLAAALDDAAVEAARARGFAAIRLFTPARHGRARRFYEREGWTAVGEEFHEPALDLALVEYRYALQGA